MALDIIVHPFLAEQEYGDTSFFQSRSRIYESYQAELAKIEDPVILDTMGSTPPMDLREDRFFHTECIPFDDHIEHFGVVESMRWENYMRQLGRIDFRTPIRVHGSFVERCVTHTAMQLVAFIMEKRHAFDNLDPDIGYDMDGWITENTSDGSFAITGVRYGVVLSESIVNPNHRLHLSGPSSRFPAGDVYYQFHDEETRLFG